VEDPQSFTENADVFISLMKEHIAAEESLIYPELRGRFPETLRRAMSREMTKRRAKHAKNSGSGFSA
jgi:hemerythrin-like domain-containing protein